MIWEVPPDMQTEKRDLRDLVRAAERVAADAGLDVIAARLRESRAERDRPGTRVAVVGDFNRGKSTLINRLAGADLLPTGNVPLTRTFVVVRAQTADPPLLEIRWPSGTSERRPLTSEDPWHGLVLAHESPDREIVEGEIGPDEPQVLLSAPSAWLAAAEIELIDTPGLHEGRVDHLLQTQRAVALSEVAVMAVSALSPLSQLERQFLEEELITKRVPHVIVVLTKADQLPPEETDEFTEWFRTQIAAVSRDIAVVLGPGPDGNAEALAILRDKTAALAHSADQVRRRDRRLAWQIADACAAIGSAAQAARDQLGTDEDKRHAVVLEAKQELDEDDLRWNQIRLGLDERRMRFTEAIRESVTASTSELFETLSADLHRVTDIKAWWECDLPVRLRRELKNLTYTLDSQISATLARDLGWLDSEVTRAFKMDRKLSGTRPLSPVTVDELPNLELEDVQRIRTATRVVSAAGGIAGAVIAFVSGIYMPGAFTLGGSALAGILAERRADAKMEEQRTVVLGHVRRLLDNLVDQFKAKLFTEVERTYQAAFGELQDAQTAWQTARLEALSSAAGTGPDVTTWADIERRANDIAGQLPLDEAIASHSGPPEVSPVMADAGTINQDDQKGGQA